MLRTSILLAFLVAFSFAPVSAGDVGLGAMIGEPTGFSGKLWLGANTAADAGVAWSLDGRDVVHIHADYLVHRFDLAEVDRGSVALYGGIGGRLEVRDVGDDKVGVRVPLGLAYLFGGASFDTFFEVAPIVNVVPDTDVDVNAALGVRYFFGSTSVR